MWRKKFGSAIHVGIYQDAVFARAGIGLTNTPGHFARLAITPLLIQRSGRSIGCKIIGEF